LGLYELCNTGDVSAMLPVVARAKKYTLIQRGPVWYVNFRADGRQFRVSTGCCDESEARMLVEATRGRSAKGPNVRVNDKHLARMIERSRYRTRGSDIPFGLTMPLIRELVERCRGYCEVSGHPLEDDGPFRPSLDRIEPRDGYVRGNIRIVCLIANTAMLHYGEAALMELALSLCKHRGLTA
jgi:hypothetical protein